MAWRSKMPIRRQLRLVILWTCAPALLLAIAAIAAYELIEARKDMAQNVMVLADVLARNTRAALQFEDETAAEKTLQALQSEPHVLGARLYHADGEPFVDYHRGDKVNLPSVPEKEGARFVDRRLVVFRPVILDGKRIGSIGMEADLIGVYERLRIFGGIGFLAMAGALLIALALASRLQRPVTEPILSLAETARVIAEQKDFSVRAAPQEQKEVALLTEAFNQMLARIQERETELAEERNIIRDAMAREMELRLVAQASEDRFRTLVEQSLIGIYVIQEGKFVYVNPSMEKIVGTSSEDLMSGPVLNLVVPEDREMVKENIRRRVAGEVHELQYSLRMIRKDGSTAYVEVRGARIDFNGKPAILGTMLDISERKEAEAKIRRLNEELEQRVRDRTAALEEANKELESFSYSVSHDLRAPLRHVHGYVEMLKKATDGQLNEKAQRYLQTIASASSEMGQLIDGLLSLSRTSRTELRERPVALNDLTQEVIRGLEMSTQGRTIEWKIADLPVVSADPTTIKQVFANLIGNAVKYTRKREIAKIEIGCHGEENGMPILFVRDNGAGFEMQYANKLFGVFQRLHRAEEFEGTGIGLATVKRIIQRHGGRIWAEAELEQGATFYFTLRRAEARMAA